MLQASIGLLERQINRGLLIIIFTQKLFYTSISLTLLLHRFSSSISTVPWQHSSLVAVLTPKIPLFRVWELFYLLWKCIHMYPFMVEWSFCRFQAASLNIEENRVILGKQQCQTSNFEIKYLFLSATILILLARRPDLHELPPLTCTQHKTMEFIIKLTILVLWSSGLGIGIFFILII